jgi:hypothetical protein
MKGLQTQELSVSTTYQNLRGFKHAETTVKKSEYNKTLKQTKEGKKTLNTLYIKHEEHTKRDKGITHKTEQEKVEVKKYTFTVTGDESNIRKAIREFISFPIKKPYVLKVVIVRVTTNKDEKDTDYYRCQWEGAKKTNNEGIKYIKAWPCKFKYHGFNVDKNDETPFECLPNASFKMYGNRDAGRSKFIAPIADNN